MHGAVRGAAGAGSNGLGAGFGIFHHRDVTCACAYLAGDFIHHIVLAQDGQLFVQWMALGSFSGCADICVQRSGPVPLMLDRKVTVRQAVLTSWSVVLSNPGPHMALWAVLIVLLTLLGLGSYLLGLVIVMPPACMPAGMPIVIWWMLRPSPERMRSGLRADLPGQGLAKA